MWWIIIIDYHIYIYIVYIYIVYIYIYWLPYNDPYIIIYSSPTALFWLRTSKFRVSTTMKYAPLPQRRRDEEHSACPSISMGDDLEPIRFHIFCLENLWIPKTSYRNLRNYTFPYNMWNPKKMDEHPRLPAILIYFAVWPKSWPTASMCSSVTLCCFRRMGKSIPCTQKWIRHRLCHIVKRYSGMFTADFW